MLSTISATALAKLAQGYRLCAQTEGKSRKTIETVADSVGYLERFLHCEGLSTNVAEIGPRDIRAFILHLQHKRCFSDHPFARPQERGLSRHTINCYLRSIRAFWSWLLSEEIVHTNPFDKVKIPSASRKVVPTLSNPQLEALLGAIDTSTAEGFRDYIMILTLLDSALRVMELVSLRLESLWLEEGVLKVMGKGGKERLVPIGKGVQRVLWKYINHFRPEPAVPNCDFVFLTADGRPITRNRIQKRMALYGERAGLKGVRCSPHTLRHTACVMWVRNGGDIFSLQKITGHSSLEVLRGYVNLAQGDVASAHRRYSAIDNFSLPVLRTRRPNRRKK